MNSPGEVVGNPHCYDHLYINALVDPLGTEVHLDHWEIKKKMCGFVGFVEYGPRSLDADQRRLILRAMGKSIAHRGPDDEQFYDDGVLSLVYRRLAIVGTMADQQPIFNKDRTSLVVCNGEIYNYQALQSQLRGRHQFSTASDSEVVLHAYQEWGVNAPLHLRGMFSAAVWNRELRQLFLVRDRLGIKPLYVCELPNGVLFGSELKGLMEHPQCPRSTDWKAMEINPLSMRTTPSFVKGIEHVPGGAFYVLTPGKAPVVKHYWKLDDHLGTAPFGTDSKKYAGEFDRLIESATVEHLQGQGPVGIHLSGGLDSSLLTAIVGTHTQDAVCFSILERTSLRVGDVDAAKAVAKASKLPWLPVLYDYRSLMDDLDFDLQTLEQSVWMMDSPLFDLEWMVKSEFNRAIKTQYPALKVLLLGQGADEFAGGYSRRVDQPYDRWDQYITGEVAPLVAAHGHQEGFSLGHHTVFGVGRKTAGPNHLYHEHMKLMVRQLQQHNLWHEDRTSSRFGMEARVPFLDHRLVELLASVPSQLHAELFWNKQIVRNSMRRRMPNYDTQRLKVGFCWTDDSRSLEIIMHSMASRVARSFQEKYVESPDFPFDRRETLALIDQVVNRSPGFYGLSALLLIRMSATIFHQMHVSDAYADLAAADHNHPSRLEIVGQAARLDVVSRQLSAEPVVAFGWRPDHVIVVPPLAQIRRVEEGPTQVAYLLCLGQETMARIACPSESGWMMSLMEALATTAGSDLTFQQWTLVLNVSAPELAQFLNVLLQCGFVSTPVLRKAGAKPQPVDIDLPMDAAAKDVDEVEASNFMPVLYSTTINATFTVH